MKNAYERLVRPLLFSIDPESAHHFALACLRTGIALSILFYARLKRFHPEPKPKNSFRVLIFRIRSASPPDLIRTALPCPLGRRSALVSSRSAPSRPERSLEIPNHGSFD